MVSGGHNRKSIDDHMADGTYRGDRHGELPIEYQLQSRNRLALEPDLAAADRWIRGRFDELAIGEGCWFSEVRGAFTVWWIERYCRLYEGEWAGEPLALRGCAECDRQWEISDKFIWPHEPGFQRHWDKHFAERISEFADCVHSGHRLDWQYEATMRTFGWVKRSQKWKREVRRFRKSSIWIAKKNKKSPTLAAWSLYLTGGDGENGQKVFLCAKDGNQARDIAGEHSLAMIDQSPILNAAFKVNLNKMRFGHIATRSFMQPLSSATNRNKESKEGINGSTVVDETHVVDRDFISRIKRAGISRSEPIHAEFSTAGNDPDGYGAERFEYARAILSGAERDDSMFVSMHAVDPSVTDDQIEADPLKYGRIANPAMGHTVDDEEFLSDYRESKASPRAFTEFKQYRLNVWAAGANPWLNMDLWKSAYREYSEAELIGIPCAVGLDLARVSDMSSAVFVFQDGDVFKQLPFFWLPEDQARRWKDKAAYSVWEQSGKLILTDGRNADYAAIEGDLAELIERFQPRSLYYDEKYAEELTQRISDRTRVERVAFGQTMVNYAGPTAAYERLLGEGRLQHNGNPVLTWQAGHVETKSDNNKNMRPVKEKRGSHKAVDGIQAAVMALGGMLLEPETTGAFFIG